MKNKIKVLVIGICMLPFAMYAQDNGKETKAQKKADKVQEKQVQQSRKDDEAKRKEHLKHQTKEVRKRMKKHKREAANSTYGDR